MRPSRLLPPLVLLSLLAGCGQKGPLYLPKPDNPAPPPQPATTTTPQATTLGEPRSTAPPVRTSQPGSSR